jgi:hypothetical protein
VGPRDVVALNRAERRAGVRAPAVYVLLGAPVHDPAELGHPVLAFIADVPHQPQAAAGSDQDAGHLGNCLPDIDPVPCLGNEHRIHRGVIKGNALG